MENIRGYRAMAIVCRQKALSHPEESAILLAQSHRWEQMAEAEIVSHFKDCNTVYRSDLTAA